MTIDLSFDPKKIARSLAWTAAGFSSAYAVSRVLVFRFGFAPDRRLPARTRSLFLVSGAIYVAGALGCEMIGGLVEQRFGRRGPEFALEVLVEESLEMGGSILFIYAVAAYLRDELSGLAVRLRFGP